LVTVPTCTNFFKGCVCSPTSTTCGAQQSCDLNGCAGGFDTKGVARCQGNFKGCACKSTSVSFTLQSLSIFVNSRKDERSYN
jgi:hypothetical protein